MDFTEAEELERLGAPGVIVQASRARAQAQAEFEVWEENWPVIEAFLRVQTQWNVAPMGGLMGLNYQSVDFTFRIYGVEDQRKVLEGLQVMEKEILGLSREGKKG